METRTIKSVDRSAAIENTQAMLGLPGPDGAIPAHNDKILVSIDTEWYARGGNFPLLEVGVALLDTRDVCLLNPTVSTDADYFKHIKVYHFRFKESGHIENKAKWLSKVYNRAGQFQYGTSEWVSRDQIEATIKKLLQIPDELNPGQYREIQMITHGGGATDFDIIGSFAQPPFEFTKSITNVTPEELQVTSKQAMESIARACDYKKPSLEKILQQVGLERYMLHNAGNDAVAQLAANLRLALMEYRQRMVVAAEEEAARLHNDQNSAADSGDDEPAEGESKDFKAGQYDILATLEDEEKEEEQRTGPTALEVDMYHNPEAYPDPPEIFEPETTLLSDLGRYLKAMPSTPVTGTLKHCIRCGSDEHNRDKCDPKFVECQRCLKRYYHITKHCPLGNGNDKWLEEQRLNNYNWYWPKDHSAGRPHKPYVTLAQSGLTEKDNILEGKQSREAVATLQAQFALELAMGDESAFPSLTLASRSEEPKTPAQIGTAASFWAAKKEVVKSPPVKAPT